MRSTAQTITGNGAIAKPNQIQHITNIYQCTGYKCCVSLERVSFCKDRSLYLVSVRVPVLPSCHATEENCPATAPRPWRPCFGPCFRTDEPLPLLLLKHSTTLSCGWCRVTRINTLGTDFLCYTS